MSYYWPGYYPSYPAYLYVSPAPSALYYPQVPLDYYSSGYPAYGFGAPSLGGFGGYGYGSGYGSGWGGFGGYGSGFGYGLPYGGPYPSYDYQRPRGEFRVGNCLCICQ